MSSVKLTLRPPPNVDFVHGYPGIPPGQDRPQAAVKGAIEVRTPASGVKAQWVRIELRKVEILPGGGDGNTFHDYVGPSPVTLWTAPDEYNILSTQDFPFSIRIPESIPPSITLENRASIHYELVATVCTRGKRSFLRKRKNIVTKEIASVTIDKHELHSTWPVYCQPEKRQIAQEGVTLMVERSHTCYGPGDRISVVATLKSDSLHTVILRGFEMTLRESTIFRAHPFGTARKAPPMTQILNVSETKLAINATLYGGTLHQAELACQLPPGHTTTTLNAARHIDVTYVLSVKALMGTGTHITMDLPVIISNWQRYVSQEAIRRIGIAPALSLVPPSSAAVMSVEPTSTPRPQQPIAPATSPALTHGRSPSIGQFNPTTTATTTTVTGRTGTAETPTTATADEFGYGVGYGRSRKGSDAKTYQNDTTTTTTTVPTPRPSVTASTVNPTARRPNSARATNPANRFTITNAEPESELPDDPPVNQTPAPVVAPTRSTSVQPTQKVWPTAVDEKKAYELARSKVEKVQGVEATLAPNTTAVPPGNNNTPPPGAGRPWLSAEREKALLQEKSQTATNKPQHQASSTEKNSGTGVSGTGGSKLTPSELYHQAMANVNANAIRNQQSSTYISPLSGGTRKTSLNVPKVPQYLTAEQEKEALKRYEEAKNAVDRLHTGYLDSNGPAPIAYDSLYPKTGGSSSAGADAPPSFEASVYPMTTSSGHMSAAAEKAALAKRIQEVDAQANNQFSAPPPSFNAAMTPPAPDPAIPSTLKEYKDAAAEKEELRKKYEARDAAAAAKKKNAGNTIPPRSASLSSNTRPKPNPPSNHGPTPDTNAVLTAAEEKAMLKAKFDAKDAKAQQKQQKKTNVNGHMASPDRVPSPRVATTTPPPFTPQLSSFQQQQNAAMLMMASSGSPSLPMTPPPPPPLMPRPPAEYIQETQEEDARVSKFAIDGASLRMELEREEVELGGRGSPGSGGSNGVFMNGHGQSGLLMAPGPPPPLPPKPAGE